MITGIIKNRSFYVVWGIVTPLLISIMFFGINNHLSNDYLKTGNKIFVFLSFLLSLLCLYIFLYSYIILHSFLKKIIKIIKKDQENTIWAGRYFSTWISFILNIDMFEFDIRQKKNIIEKEEATYRFFSALKKQFWGIRKTEDLQKLADLFLKYESFKIAKIFANQKCNQKTFNALSATDKKVEDYVFSASREEIQGAVKNLEEANKTASKSKKEWKKSQKLITMIGLEVFPSFKLYLKLKPDTL